MKNLELKPEVQSQSSKPLSNKLKMAAAAIAMAALNATACGGSPFSAEQPVDQDAAARDANNDTLPADGGKDANHPDAKHDSDTDAGLTEAAPDGALCNKVTVTAVAPTAFSIKAGQAIPAIEMMSLRITSDCGNHTLKG